MRVLEVEGTPLVRARHIVRPRSRQLSPAAEAFRYFIIERGEAYPAGHDTPRLQAARER